MRAGSFRIGEPQQGFGAGEMVNSSLGCPLCTIERLRPGIVVAGHKKLEADDEATRILGETRAYIRDFAAATAVATSPDEIVQPMTAKYPAHGNLTTLYFSAHAAMKARAATGST